MRHSIALLFFLSVAAFASDGNWPRWRGPNDNGSASGGTYPVKFDADSGWLWKTPLPGKGCSTPIVWNHAIYVTAPVEGKDALLVPNAALRFTPPAVSDTKYTPEPSRAAPRPVSNDTV
mgnify:CR=1 FL=1